MSSQKRNVHLKPVNVNLFRERIFADIIKALEMRSSWFRMGLCNEFNDEFNMSVPIREEDKTQGEEDYVKTETEIRKMCL